MAKKKAAAAPAPPAATPPEPEQSGQAGRPPIELDPKMVQALSQRGLTQEDCAAVLGCSVDTLQRRYLAAYELGLQECKASLRRKQYELAQGGNVTMLIWLGKNLLGQKDKHEVTGADGRPLIPDVDREEILGKLIGSGPTPPADRIH